MKDAEQKIYLKIVSIILSYLIIICFTFIIANYYIGQNCVTIESDKQTIDGLKKQITILQSRCDSLNKEINIIQNTKTK